MKRLAGVLLLLSFAAPYAWAAPDGSAPRRLGVGDRRVEALNGAIQVGLPHSVELSTTELVVELPVYVRPVGIDGTVDRVEFSDMALNGVPFEVEPYSASFDLPAKELVRLPAPLRLHLNFERAAPGILEEALLPGDTLRLTGRVKVDGTFRKWFFSLKRSVEVPIDASGPNPLAEYHPSRVVLRKMQEWGYR
jgi:hypothetical protein